MVRFKPGRLLFTIIVIIVLLLLFIRPSFVFGGRGYDVLVDSPNRSPPSDSRPLTPEVVLGETCSPFLSGGMDDVTIVIKFGAAEVASRLPSYLKALTQCKPNLLLFSDREGSIDGIPIIDTLANLLPEHKHQNPDFEIYDEIQRATNKTLEKTTAGWKLDKYKFLPMMELAANSRPDSNWFVFVELDTYANWDNFYRFLRRFDPTQPHYFGSPVWPKKKAVFAHGGSGFVLSHGAMRKLVAQGRLFTEDHTLPGTHLFGKKLQQECCGDDVLAQVLKQGGVKIRGYWPMFNGEKLSSLPFGHEQWCEAVLTLHHLGEEDFDVMRRFESSRRLPTTPLTFKELFTYIEPSLKDQVDDWSNVSEEIALKTGRTEGLSFAACFNACLKDSKCVQCEHSGDTCRLSHSVRLGHKRSREGNKRWTSGWVKSRIESFKTAQPKCQGGAHIVHPNP